MAALCSQILSTEEMTKHTDAEFPTEQLEVGAHQHLETLPLNV